MRPSRQALIAAAFLGMLAGGCSTTAGRCEDACEWGDKCAGDPASSCADNCESDYDDAGDKCQDSFDSFADCLSDNDLACSDACNSDFLKWALDCRGQFRQFP
jgi:hypothetical protein